jgi:hypothetical protein
MYIIMARYWREGDRRTTHAFPTGPIDQLLDEIERGYRGSV